MARRKASRRTKKVPPTELTMFGTLEAGSSNIVDVGSCLSQINRKTFRQGMQYAIQSIEFYSAASDIQVARLPHNWVCVNAWTKGMALWKQQQDDRLDQAGLTQTIAAHRDFKIYLDADHADGNYTQFQPITLGTGADSEKYRLLSSAQAVSPTVTKDWEYSEVVIPNKTTVGNTVEYKLHMLGDDNTGGAHASVGLIHAYAESRNRPMQTDPNIVDVATGGLYGEMFDVGDDSNQITTNAQEKNDKLPYLNDIDTALEFYPGGANTGSGMTLVDQLSIQAGNRTVASSVTSPFFANCGLIFISCSGATNVKITLAPGHYKGVMARPMQDVN